MRGKRLIAPLVALLVITAGLGGVGVPDRADPVQEGQALAPPVIGAVATGAAAVAAGAALENEFGFLGGDNEVAEGEAVPANDDSTDEVTNVDAEQEHDNLRAHGEYANESYRALNTQVNNTLKLMLDTALGDAKAELLSEYANGSSEQKAEAEAMNVSEDYYTVQTINRLRSDFRLLRGSVQANNAYCSHPEFNDGDGCSDQNSHAGVRMGGTSDWSPDTTYNVSIYVDGHQRYYNVPGNSSIGDAFVPGGQSGWPGNITNVVCVTCDSLRPLGENSWSYKSSYNGSSFDIQVAASRQAMNRPYEQLAEENWKAKQEVDVMSAVLYSEQPNVSDIDKDAFVGPSTTARRSMNNTSNPYASAALMAGNISSTASSLNPNETTAQHLKIYLTEDDRTIEKATIFTDANITFEVGNVYDPADYNESIWAASMNGSGDVFILQQPFQVKSITGSDGSDLDSVNTSPSVDPVVYNTSTFDPAEYQAAMQNYSDRLEQIIQEAESGSGGGGGAIFGGLSSGVGTPGMVGGAFAIGAIIVLIARPWGA